MSEQLANAIGPFTLLMALKNLTLKRGGEGTVVGECMEPIQRKEERGMWMEKL